MRETRYPTRNYGTRLKSSRHGSLNINKFQHHLWNIQYEEKNRANEGLVIWNKSPYICFILQKYCSIFGGDLAIIETETEEQVIEGIMQRIHGNGAISALHVYFQK